MSSSELTKNILSTLLYYEIFDHPLSFHEMYYLFPENSLTKSTLRDALESLTTNEILKYRDGFYMISRNGNNLSATRLERQHHAARRMRIARGMAHIIKRFPFVRAIFLSGDLSKGVASAHSDIDYVIVTEPGRLWICRAFLMVFKKTVLLNSKKYFCLNYYVDTDHLALSERDYYTATEIAHLKPLFNFPLYLRYMNANNWIRNFFPNYQIHALTSYRGNRRSSILQKLFELPFSSSVADRLDLSLMKMMQRVWKRRYPQYDDETRDKIFRCSRYESRAFIGNFAEKVLSIYTQKLSQLH